jgi:hypothetical protein
MFQIDVPVGTMPSSSSVAEIYICDGERVVKALYQNRLCVIVEITGDVAILACGADTFAVPLGSAELVVDPTDTQVAGADDAPGDEERM